ncbi:helix-turn-helix domain-containing protein [Herbaspirillum lusitanum]|jgi:AraC-like DNA-binding protein|uniref:Helix-turn-helix domain-containing protein n=1 Tax=Herbaspirillum lusitanum TaxID=213312 RepID=A0ABW9A5J5_9BURK
MEQKALKSWSWSTDPLTLEERENAWSDTLQQITMPMARSQDHNFHGDVASVISPLGIEFSRLQASPQTISGRCENSSGSMWLALLINGTFIFDDGNRTTHLEPGDILYGPTGRDSTLKLPEEFGMLYIKIPKAVLHPRLLNPIGMQVGAFRRQSGGNRVFAGMLQSIADNLEDLTAAQIRPIEISLSEFVIAGLAESAAVHSFGNVARAANFHRVCQSIEQYLGDPELDLRKIADEQNASPRYIQKLFEEANLSFGQYVRQRRLTQCRADLASTAHRNLSILNICFRWGFNDAAHFSRSFRSEFGVTPREFRRAQLGVDLQ